MIALKRVLVPFDFSWMSEAAVTYATGLAASFQAELDVLHVVPQLNDANNTAPVEAAYQRLKTVAPGENRMHAAKPHVRSGTPHVEIRRFAKERDVDVIVMGTHGRGFVGHALMGSVAEKVVRNAPCPVLTVRGPQRESVVPNVLVAFDFEPVSETALVYGREVARAFGARLHVLHVMQNDFLRPTMADPRALVVMTRQRVRDRLTDEDSMLLQATAAVEVSDAPAAAIVDYAEYSAIDLIVIGTHGRQGANRLLLGSVAERIVRTAPCPVLTVRHPEREFVLVDRNETSATTT